MIDLKYDIENSGGAEFGPDMEPNVLPEDRYSGKQFALSEILWKVRRY